MEHSKSLVLHVLIIWSLVMVLPVAGRTAEEGGDTKVAVTSGPAELLIRCDDIGFCHSVNLAAEELAKSGVRFSASVLFVAPWYREAVGILKQFPNVAVGVHLALNSEWENYKWGPVLGRSAVPSLVDSDGYFFGTRTAFDANGPKTSEVRMELRAQIERAIHSGLNIKYLDTHMSTIDENPEYMAIVEGLAKEYHLVISGSLGERDMETMYSAPVDRKLGVLLEQLSCLSPDSVNLLVCHIAVDSRESEALIDANPSGPREVGRHRQGELSALLSPEFAKAIRANKIKLATYADLAAREAGKPEGK